MCEKITPRRCTNCGGNSFKKFLGTYTFYNNAGYGLELSGIPCFECLKCKTRYFDQDVLKRTENELRQLFVFTR